MKQRLTLGAFACSAALIAFAGPLSADPTGFSSRAALNVEIKTGKGLLAISGDVNVEQRGSVLRFDVNSLLLSQGAGNQASELVPKGGYSIVYDPTTMQYTVWSAARHAYYTGSSKPVAPASPSPAPEATAGPTATPSSPFATIKDLRALSFSVNLANKETIEGHVTTPIDFKMNVESTSTGPVAASGRINFADDLAGTPILVVVSATRGTSGAQGGTLRASMTGVSQTAPPASDFVPPDGYSKAQSISDVLVLPKGMNL